MSVPVGPSGAASMHAQGLEHAVQVRGGGFDVLVLVLGGARLGRQDAATVHGLEVAVGELVATLVVDVLRVVDAEVPARLRPHPVLLDERVLLRGRRLVLAPVVALVQDALPSLASRWACS